MKLRNNGVRSFALVMAGAFSATVVWHVFGSAIASSNADTYKQLNIFGDVFDRVRADYV
jgi:carboxyl-terminal processing protease